MFSNLQRIFTVLFSVLSTVIFLGGCELNAPSEDELGQDRKSIQPFVRNAPEFTLSVNYQMGAEPYVGTAQGGVAVWSIVERNLRQILPSKISSIRVPYSLAQMAASRVPSRNSWTESGLRDLAFQTQFSQVGSGNNILTIYFLRGVYKTNNLAMGLHFHGTPAIFVFKDVIQSLGGSITLQQLAEQSVILHEIGHALGMVNGYVEMASYPHEDPSSSSHCTNPNCVMYKKNNGSKSLQTFIQQMNTSQSLNFFGQECLVDLNTFYRRTN